MTVFSKKYGFIKPSYDAHTLGLQSVIDALTSCGQRVIVADQEISNAVHHYKHEAKTKKIVDWIVDHQLDYIGVTYRLDSDDAIEMIGYLIQVFKDHKLFHYQDGPLEKIYFAGLMDACQAIEKQHKGLVTTFIGGENIWETLEKMEVDCASIDKEWSQQHEYDKNLQKFAHQLILNGDYQNISYKRMYNYPGFGSKDDTLVKRLNANQKTSALPLIRVHVGPYYSNLSNKENIELFKDWSKTLAQSQLLDVLSIGSSQLSQSHFNKPWYDMPNGGGVPIENSEQLREIYDISRPMLLRTYAGTAEIETLASIYEETINIGWHALSLWWFNKLDDRGPYDLYTNLVHHINTIDIIAKSNKPFEANVSHHFAFRGSDDISYIVSAYLCAKLAKMHGIKTFILQNMLNTPRLTWGVADLAKSQALIELVRSLEDDQFTVILQPRAGLDYFKPDLFEAKQQLASVSAMMDDIEPNNPCSPPIVHVVSYSEAISLATPLVILESIQITQHAISSYRKAKKLGHMRDVGNSVEVTKRKHQLIAQSKQLVLAIEKHVNQPYSADGLYTVFASGFLPVPYLWREKEKFIHAVNWQVKPYLGSMCVFDKDQVMDIQKRILIALQHIQEVQSRLALMKLKNIK